MVVIVGYWPTISARSYGIHIATKSPILEERIVFDWDEHNVVHIDRHNVSPMEVEDAFLDPRRLGSPARNVGNEKRWAVLGATGEGRVLLVVFTRRQGFVRVVTARDATEREKQRYQQRGK